MQNAVSFDGQTGKEVCSKKTIYVPHKNKMNELEEELWKTAIGNTLDAYFLEQKYVPVKHEAKHGNTINSVEYCNGNFILKSEFRDNQNSEAGNKLTSNIFLKREIMDDWKKVTEDFKFKYGIVLDDSIIFQSYKKQSSIDISSVEICEGIDIDWMIMIIGCAKEQGIKVDEEQLNALKKIREENQMNQIVQ